MQRPAAIGPGRKRLLPRLGQLQQVDRAGPLPQGLAAGVQWGVLGRGAVAGEGVFRRPPPRPCPRRLDVPRLRLHATEGHQPRADRAAGRRRGDLRAEARRRPRPLRRRPRRNSRSWCRRPSRSRSSRARFPRSRPCGRRRSRRPRTAHGVSPATGLEGDCRGQAMPAGWTPAAKGGYDEPGANPPPAADDRSASGWKGVQR